MNRILVIRGGAIGDFILTLPAIKLLRDNYPRAHLEILGYKHIVTLAENRFYAQAVRSIEYAPLARFFARNAELAPDLIEYFGSFDLLVSYLFDPDGIFEKNLRRCGIKDFIAGSPKIGGHEHAALQLTRPLQQANLNVTDHAAMLYPSQADRDAALAFLNDASGPIIALHPGSGSEKKNWPLDNWIELGRWLITQNFVASLLLVAGEADQDRCDILQEAWRDLPVRTVRNLPLPELAALISSCVLFLGHDSGISHLAAAAGARCLLLFGPTDPAIWAPANENVRVIRAPQGDLRTLSIESVRNELANVGAALAPRQ